MTLSGKKHMKKEKKSLKSHLKTLIGYMLTLSEKCPYSGLFWSTFSPILAEYGEILLISPYSFQMQENKDQNNSEYGHF